MRPSRGPAAMVRCTPSPRRTQAPPKPCPAQDWAMLRPARSPDRPIAAPGAGPPSRSRARARDGVPMQEPRLTFDTLGLSADLLQTVAEEGYTAPTPVQEAAIPLVLAGPRRPRRRPDRHRQDRRLRAARSSTGCGAREHELLAGPPPGPRPHPRPDPRARDAGRRERPHLRSDRPAALDRRLRRHPDGPPDQGAARRRRDPRGDAGPPARPRRPEGRQPRPGRDPRPRRGRPDARHGLPARHPADHRAAPPEAART